MVRKSQSFRIDEFARIVHPRDGHRKVFAMIDAYLDESGIQTGAAMCAIAGYFGEQKHFRPFERDWKKVLAKFDVKLAELHAKDFVKDDRHKQLIKSLSATIAQHKKIRPVSFGVVVNDFYSFSLDQRKFLTGATLRRGKFVSTGSPNKPYFVPFQLCVRVVTDHTPSGAKAHFFFGLDSTFSGYATALFKQMETPNEHSDWQSRDRLGDPSFPKASETPQLQAADLLVHLTYLHMLERHREGKWLVQPQGNLRLCLRNACCPSDHAFQDRSTLVSHLKRIRALALKLGDWNSRLDDGLI